MLCTDSLPWKTLPLFVLAVVGTNLLLFDAADSTSLGLYLDSSFVWWTVLTCGFAHASVPHLVGNQIALLLVGSLCEGVHGHARTAALYMYGLVAGSVGFAAVEGICEGQRRAYLVGSSPGIYALVAAIGAHLLLNWSESRYGRVWAGVVAYLAVVDILVYFTSYDTSVAYGAHLFGALHGGLVGVCLLRNAVVHPFEKRMQAVCLLATCLLLTGTTSAFVTLHVQWERQE